jgi:hypothetical protein
MKSQNNDRDEDRGGVFGYESKAERARQFDTEGAVSAYARIIGEEGARPPPLLPREVSVSARTPGDTPPLALHRRAAGGCSAEPRKAPADFARPFQPLHAQPQQTERLHCLSIITPAKVGPLYRARHRAGSTPPAARAHETGGTKPSPDPEHRHRFPAEITSHVFSLSLRNVELAFR